MSMKKCVITGGNTGIGKATAIALAKQNYEVIIFSRDSQKSDEAIQEIISASGNEKVSLIKVDLSEIDAIKDACGQVSSKHAHIDLLINNAGVMRRKAFLNSKGVEQTLAVNYLAPFLTARLLMEKLQTGSRGNLINVTSALYKKGKVPTSIVSAGPKFDGSQAYADSKMLVLLDTMYLSRKYAGEDVSINCMHPGVVGTEVFRDYPKWFASLLNLMITKPEKAGHSLATLATDIAANPGTGQYYNINKIETIKGLEALLGTYEQLATEAEKLVEL